MVTTRKIYIYIYTGQVYTYPVHYLEKALTEQIIVMVKLYLTLN